ncbi:MAG: rhomboid family intramembrane serine protease [Bacillales bacterium]|nr:rhomboid family intramembrane serine protease [Bacillales bacterium]
MSFREDYIFWRLAYFLLMEQDYRLMAISENRREMWLENTAKKGAEVVRLLRSELDWSNWLERDIQLTAVNGEKIRKRFMRRGLNVVSMYVSKYPPVDDYEHLLKARYTLPQASQTNVTPILFAQGHEEEAFDQLNTLFQIETRDWHFRDVYEESEVQSLEQLVLTGAVQKEEKDQNLLEYGNPFFTYLFIAVQVAVFLLMEMNGGSTNTDTLIRFGAKFNPLILNGEWWRFFTPIFLHIGLLHLLMNTMALYYLGTMVEKIFGRWRFLWIYLFSGFLGSVASFVFTPNLSAGASGAIFGCFGALLFFGFVNRSLFFRTMGMNMIVVIIINLIFGFTVPGIDNSGHIGGLIGGFLAAGVSYLPEQRKWSLQATFFLLSFLLTVILLWSGYHGGFVAESFDFVHHTI